MTKEMVLQELDNSFRDIGKNDAVALTSLQSALKKIREDTSNIESDSSKKIPNIQKLFLDVQRNIGKKDYYHAKNSLLTIIDFVKKILNNC